MGGIRTLAQVLGIRALRWFYMLLIVGCVLSLAGMGIAQAAPGLLALTPLLLILLAKPLACVWRKQRLPDIDARTAKFESALLIFLHSL